MPARIVPTLAMAQNALAVSGHEEKRPVSHLKSVLLYFESV